MVLNKLFGKWTPPPPSEPQRYELPCPSCGAVVRGRRAEGYQAIRCPHCGGGMFILPQSPFAEPPRVSARRVSVLTAVSAESSSLDFDNTSSEDGYDVLLNDDDAPQSSRTHKGSGSGSARPKSRASDVDDFADPEDDDGPEIVWTDPIPAAESAPATGQGQRGASHRNRVAAATEDAEPTVPPEEVDIDWIEDEPEPVPEPIKKPKPKPVSKPQPSRDAGEASPRPRLSKDEPKGAGAQSSRIETKADAKFEWLPDPEPSATAEPLQKPANQPLRRMTPSPLPTPVVSPQSQASKAQSSSKAARGRESALGDMETFSEYDEEISDENENENEDRGRPGSGLSRVARHRNLLIFVLVVTLAGGTIWYRMWRQRLESYPQLVREGEKRGIPALESGKFDLAKRILSEAVRAADGLGGKVEGASDIRQAALEAEIYTDLCPKSLEDLLEDAGRYSPANEWADHFRAVFRGNAVVLEVTIANDNGPRGYELDYVIFSGRGPNPDRVGRIDLRGFQLLESYKPRAGERIRFAARLESLALDEESGDWIIRFQPKSGTWIQFPKALAAMGWTDFESPPPALNFQNNN